MLFENQSDSAMTTSMSRTIGTTAEAIKRAEKAIDFKFPLSFHDWLIENNGRSADDVTIFPVFDDRDPRKTWDSIVRNFEQNWSEWLSQFDDNRLRQLLPFAEFGTGDFYCFDYSNTISKQEPSVVIWSHENGNMELRASNFGEFLTKLADGEFED